MARFLSIAMLAALWAALPAHADDLRIAHPDQADFNSVARDVTAAFDYRALGPSVHGILGFDVSGFASVTSIHDRAAWQRLTGTGDSTVTVGGLEADKGLPGGFDVGAFVAGVSGNGITLYGGQLRYALMQPTMLTPAVILRGSYTGASGIENMDYRSYGADVTVAQPLPLLTPYAGLGYVWGRLSPNGGFGLEDADVQRVKSFAGLRFSLFGLLQAVAEYERLGSDNIYSARLGLSI